ncbi:MAG: DUF5657 family protein [Patescibacteria group bacterium]
MEIFNSFINGDITNIVVKVFFLTCSFLFSIFLLVVFKQVTSMNAIVSDENDSLILKLIAFSLLISSVSLFLAALVIL